MNIVDSEFRIHLLAVRTLVTTSPKERAVDTFSTLQHKTFLPLIDAKFGT